MKSSAAYRTVHEECCGQHDCTSGLRNNYFEGKRLSVDSYRIEQQYSLERRRLINRAIHGFGVVYGFDIKPDADGRFTIGPGLALDECGRELLQTESIADGQVTFLDDKGEPLDPKVVTSGGMWLLSVHYAEQDMAPRSVPDRCHCERDEWDRMCETVRYSLQRRDDSHEGFECELKCDCGTSHTDESDLAVEIQKLLPVDRGPKGCLCNHLADLAAQIGKDCDSLKERDEPCGRVRIDLSHGVPLAQVQLTKTKGGPWILNEVNSCGPRRLVKRNDLLFDLIRGCDLTRISEIGWADWHRRDASPVSIAEFSEALLENKGYKLWLEFSRPVRTATLTRDCFAITVLSREPRTKWWRIFRVPIDRVDHEPRPNDPGGCVRRARLVLDPGWIKDEASDSTSLFFEGHETLVEIEVRGDFILDCNGQAVDANAVGRHSSPSGNGTPGGTFLSTFRVSRESPPSQSNLQNSADPYRGT